MWSRVTIELLLVLDLECEWAIFITKNQFDIDFYVFFFCFRHWKSVGVCASKHGSSILSDYPYSRLTPVESSIVACYEQNEEEERICKYLHSLFAKMLNEQSSLVKYCVPQHQLPCYSKTGRHSIYFWKYFFYQLVPAIGTPRSRWMAI